jgi:alkaline phosphatase D
MASLDDPWRTAALDRREILLGSAGLLAGALIGSRVNAAPRWAADPFQLGVASGCPRPDGFVIWTRLAPDPMSTDPATPGGMTGGDVPVSYEIATDPAMRTIVRRGEATAEAGFAHSVHERVNGLQPGRPYWYRFACGGAQSRIGRARTALAIAAPLQRMRFGFVSCSHYEFGYFSAYRHLAAEDPDLVVFLGDYIYKHVERKRPTVRRHSGDDEAKTLPGYRNRYAQYRLDPDLQDIHATTTALDDHEVQNDYADKWSLDFTPPDQFLLRRAAAYQAFYEHLPLDPQLSRPQNGAMRIYDRFAFGDLVQFHVLDGRQYRSREACYVPPDHGGAHAETDAGCPERAAPERSMLGRAQEAWLFDGLAKSQVRWNVLAQDVLMAQLRERQPDGEIGFWTDDWNGYPACRQRLLQHIHENRVANPVVIGGDSHCFWANEVKLDFDDPKAPAVASEMVGTSITSPAPNYELFAAFLPDNPHVKFFESRKRGYVLADVTTDRMESRFQIVSDVTDPKASRSTLATCVVENGRAGVNI